MLKNDMMLYSDILTYRFQTRHFGDPNLIYLIQSILMASWMLLYNTKKEWHQASPCELSFMLPDMLQFDKIFWLPYFLNQIYKYLKGMSLNAFMPWEKDQRDALSRQYIFS